MFTGIYRVPIGFSAISMEKGSKNSDVIRKLKVDKKRRNNSDVFYEWHQTSPIWGLLTYLSNKRVSLNHGLRTPREEMAFTARPKIHSHSQIFRYGGSIFCLPHQPNFSDIFDFCLHWVSVVGARTHKGDSL